MEWAALVESRILAVFDLPAADAIYKFLLASSKKKF